MIALLILGRCIFQDNEADWSIEASRMGDIYSRSACTIAATAAEDSSGGLFSKRTPSFLRPRRIETTWTPNPNANKNKKFALPQAGIYWCDTRELWTRAIERAPLNSRAWVCQERHLSPRIMHFGDTQLFWECHEGTACENYPGGLPEWADPDWFANSAILRQSLYQLRLEEANTSLKVPGARRDITISDIRPLLRNEFYFHWAAFRIRYTECSLTREEDKLVAIQGIAKQFGRILSDQLIAGLWSNRLLEELCWHKFSYANEPPPRKLIKWRAPTWSWASSDARIWVSNVTKFHASCGNKQIWVELENVDVKAKASGELEKASLRIRCKPICAVIEPDPSFDDETKYSVYGILTFQNSNVSIRAKRSGNSKFDIRVDDLEREKTRYVYMIVIQRCPHHPRVCRDVDNEDSEDSEDDNEDSEDDSEDSEDDSEDGEDDADLADCAEGLLLVPRYGCKDVFERVGLFTAKDDPNVRKMLDEHEAADSRVITLV